MTLEQARALIQQATASDADTAAEALSPKKLAKDDTVWLNLTESSLPPAIAALYAAKREADALAKAARMEFEAAFRAVKNPPAGKVFRFGYNWGKLSIGVAADDGKPKGGSKTASFDDL